MIYPELVEGDPCTTDAEAVLKASQLKDSELTTDSKLSTLNSKLKYPVRYFASDTTGEKAYEEFYVPGEKIDMQRFQALGVVEQTARHPMSEVDTFFAKLEDIFTHDDLVRRTSINSVTAHHKSAKAA